MREIYLPSPVRMVIWRRRIVALLRVLCGCLCAVDACYRWLAIQNLLLKPSSLVIGWFAFGLHPAHLFALWVVAMETVIACCLLCGALTNLACVLGIFLALLGCSTTGALAAFLKPGSFDLGILFVTMLTLLGLGLANAGQMYGIDGLLSHKLGRWSFLASSGRGTRHVPAPIIAGVSHDAHVRNAREASPPTILPDELSFSPSVPFIESDVQTIHVAYTPKKRQRVLFM